MTKVADLKFDEGNTSELFKLADGHQYFIHRISREGKPDVFSLLGGDPGMFGAFTPYVSEHQMDAVLRLRSEDRRAVDAVPDEISATGFTCPGCGAKVTETGVHVGPPAAPVDDNKPDDKVTPVEVAGQEYPTRKPRSRFLS